MQLARPVRRLAEHGFRRIGRMHPSQPPTRPAIRRERVVFGTLLPILCLLVGDVTLLLATGTSEVRQFAAMPVAAASVPGIPVLMIFNYMLSARKGFSRGQLFIYGLRLPLAVLAVEILFIFHY